LSGRALVTGAGGQDGSYLTELLLGQDYEVVGVVHDTSALHANLDGVRDRIELVEVDLIDQDALAKTLRAHRPTEVYNLASPSFVPRSWD
jgi:GDPmannose 4,6-dehydratase